MVSSSAYALLRFAGWSYMPDLATRQLLLFVHRLMASPPPPRTPKYALHYRIAFSVVVLGFLSYNMVEALRAMEPSFYDILSVHPDVDETELKQAFKLFARRHHPDRGGSEDYFILGRTALQTLKDPIKRFAYDRFGPESATWSHCKTIPDYLHQGLIKSSGYHIVTGSGLFIWSSIQSSSVTFWRYLLFLSVLATELVLVLNYTPAIWTFVFPQNVPYQHILFLHQLFLFSSVALSKVAPVMFPMPIEENWDPTQFGQMLEMTNQMSKLANKELFGMLHDQLRSIHPQDTPTQLVAGVKVVQQPSEQVMELLTTEMENMMIESKLRQSTGPISSAWEAAVTKGKSKDLKKSQGLLSPVSITSGMDSLSTLRAGDAIERSKVSWGSSYVRGRSLSC